MTAIADEILTHLLHRPDHQHAYHHDPEYHDKLNRLRHCLNIVDGAMEAQDVYAPSERRKVLVTLVEGVPNADEAMRSIDERADLARKMLQQPFQVAFDETEDATTPPG